jgi:glucan phosphoethanolaminetransferase (alkaline phosphatase superfamily)
MRKQLSQAQELVLLGGVYLVVGLCMTILIEVNLLSHPRGLPPLWEPPVAAAVVASIGAGAAAIMWPINRRRLDAAARLTPSAANTVETRSQRIMLWVAGITLLACALLVAIHSGISRDVDVGTVTLLSAGSLGLTLGALTRKAERERHVRFFTVPGPGLFGYFAGARPAFVEEPQKLY